MYNYFCNIFFGFQISVTVGVRIRTHTYTHIKIYFLWKNMHASRFEMFVFLKYFKLRSNTICKNVRVKEIKKILFAEKMFCVSLELSSQILMLLVFHVLRRFVKKKKICKFVVFCQRNILKKVCNLEDFCIDFRDKILADDWPRVEFSVFLLSEIIWRKCVLKYNYFYFWLVQNGIWICDWIANIVLRCVVCVHDYLAQLIYLSKFLFLPGVGIELWQNCFSSQCHRHWSNNFWWSLSW